MSDLERAGAIALDWFGAIGVLPGHESSRQALERHINEALAEVRLDERRAIVAWLRAKADRGDSVSAQAPIWTLLRHGADLIERGEHLDPSS